MKITIANFKGGVGKSTLAHQLITSYGFKGVQIDPYGGLHERLPGQVERIRIGAASLPAFPEKTIIDFGAFKDEKILMAARQSDVVMVPYMPTLESSRATIETLGYLLAADTPVLMVANMIQRPDETRGDGERFAEILGYVPEIYTLPLSLGLQSAYNLNRSLLELADEKTPRAETYRRGAKQIEGLYAKILGYRQPDAYRSAS